MQATVNESLTSQDLTGFYFGTPRCDNVLAQLVHASGHDVQNPAFSIHAIEIDLDSRRSRAMYGTANAVEGDGMAVVLSDRFVFY